MRNLKCKTIAVCLQPPLSLTKMMSPAQALELFKKNKMSIKEKNHHIHPQSLLPEQLIWDVQKSKWTFSYLKTYIISLLENTGEKTGNNKKTIQTQLLNFNLGKTNFTSDAVKDFTVTNLTFPSIGLFGFFCLFVLIQPPNPSLELCGTKIFFPPCPFLL